MTLNNLYITMLAKLDESTWRVVLMRDGARYVSDQATLEACFMELNKMLKGKHSL